MINNNYYKHYSFDLWLTLIKSNKDFKLNRSLLFKDFFGINKDVESVHDVIKYYDNTCNSINEITGGNIDTFEIYLLILNHFNVKTNLNELADFYNETEKLFFNYPPELINKELLNLLFEINNQGKTANVLSNTGFIKGKTMRNYLENVNILKYFDFQIFSDEVNISKPNSKIFDLMISKIKGNIQLSEIIHIGDNKIADYDSAIEYGINAYLIDYDK